MDKSTEYYSQGRVAYYLKGTVEGKYLITSALDTGTNDYNKMFKNLDSVEHDRLLTNLDPDKLYPVYGDSSTIVYDAQSQGKFYLAVDSDEFHLLVGNYPIALTDTELARYQATLYGARAAYQSVSRSKYGKADTEIIVFGANVSRPMSRMSCWRPAARCTTQPPRCHRRERTGHPGDTGQEYGIARGPHPAAAERGLYREVSGGPHSLQPADLERRPGQLLDQSGDVAGEPGLDPGEL